MEEERHAAMLTPTALQGLTQYLPTTPPPSGRSPQTPQCPRPGHRGDAEGLILLPHDSRLRRGCWTGYTIPRIPANGDSIVATRHPPRLAGNGANVVFERH